MNIRGRAQVIALTVPLWGCAGPDVLFPHNYPNSWPPLQIKDGQACLLLSGDYRYLGERGYSERLGNEPPSFEVTALFRPHLLGRPVNVRLRHNIESGSLTATFNGENLMWPPWAAARRQGIGEAMAGEVLTPSKHVTLTRGNFRCADGWTTWVYVFDGSGNGESGSHHGWRTLRLSLAADRSLIVEHVYDEETWFFFGLSRNHFRGTAWYRFESTTASP